MKATELRIGNNIEVYRKPSDKDKTALRVAEIFLEDGDYFVTLKDGFIVNVKTGITPIPITKEWLRKADIEWMVIYNHSDVWTFRIGDEFRVDVRFIHEVQNLHYDLYKEELNF